MFSSWSHAEFDPNPDEQWWGAGWGPRTSDSAADGGFNASVRGDGKLLGVGEFLPAGRQARSGIALLNADGTLDDSFRPPEILLGHRRLETARQRVRTRSSGRVRRPTASLPCSPAPSPAWDGQPRTTLVRAKLPDGSVDEDFGRELRFDGAVFEIAVQPDGRLAAGGPLRADQR
ncbi:MAG: delta-60 repeat domain-containing protein [Verrucomicrobiae bacterium]|nr:delta-60 repeat domain-containing protein [Verrucomicrobiae bacterium]